MSELKFPVYEFRLLPEQIGGKVYRYAGGKWIKDDGEYDLAFAVIGFGAPMCYYVDLPYRPNLLWKWVLDGQWGGYVQKHPKGNAWHYMSRNGEKSLGDNWKRETHPNEIAGESGMDFVCNSQSCANGGGVEFEIGDPYIIAGLMREKESKKIITFPEIFNCIHCGNLSIKEDSRISPPQHLERTKE